MKISTLKDVKEVKTIAEPKSLMVNEELHLVVGAVVLGFLTATIIIGIILFGAKG